MGEQLAREADEIYQAEGRTVTAELQRVRGDGSTSLEDFSIVVASAIGALREALLHVARSVDDAAKT